MLKKLLKTPFSGKGYKAYYPNSQIVNNPIVVKIGCSKTSLTSSLIACLRSERSRMSKGQHFNALFLNYAKEKWLLDRLDHGPNHLYILKEVKI